MADSDIEVTSLLTAGGASTIMLDWSVADDGRPSPLPYLWVDHFEVWAAASNDRAFATKLTDTPDLNYTVPNLLYGQVVYFWIRPVDVSSNQGDFCPSSATAGIIGTAKDKIGPDDLVPIEVSMLGHELFNAYGMLTSDDPAAVFTLVAQLLRRQDELALAVIDQQATTKQFLRVLAAQHNGANAAIIENSLAIVSETEARATAITEAIATFGDGIGAWWGEVSATKNIKTVTRVSGPSFTDSNCAAGAIITINTTPYTVASRTNGDALQITSNYTGNTGTKDAIIKPFVDIPEEFTLADGYLEIDAAANTSDATATITAKVRARAGDEVSQAGWILKAFADGDGGTIQQFGVLGTFYVFHAELDDGIPVFSVDGSGLVHAKALTFDEVVQSKKKSSGTPLIYLDGATGFFSLGAG